jgi:predicted membrane protein
MAKNRFTGRTRHNHTTRNTPQNILRKRQEPLRQTQASLHQINQPILKHFPDKFAKRTRSLYVSTFSILGTLTCRSSVIGLGFRALELYAAQSPQRT